MKTTKTVYKCDLCEAELPEDYVSTDGEGNSYFVKNLYDELPLSSPVLECNAMVIHVRIGGRKDETRYNDLCNKCRLKLLKQAVKHLESEV